MRLQQLDTELRNRGLKLTFREKQSLLSQSGPISEVLERYLNPPQAPKLPELQMGGPIPENYISVPASTTSVQLPPMLTSNQLQRSPVNSRSLREIDETRYAPIPYSRTTTAVESTYADTGALIPAHYIDKVSGINRTERLRDSMVNTAVENLDLSKKYYKKYTPENIEAVKALQRELISKGLDVGAKGVDGKFGDDTLAAYRKSQNIKDLSSEQKRDECRNSDGSYKEGCAEYVSEVTKNQILGSAWEMAGNIESDGGTLKYNIYDDPRFKDVKTVKDLKRVTQEVKATSKAKSEDFEVGDAVGIYWEGSGYHQKAMDEGKRGTKNTHVGIVTSIENGIPIISHNIHGKLHHEPYNHLTIGWIGSPSKVPELSTKNDKSGDVEKIIDGTVEDMPELFNVNIDKETLRKDIRGILQVESGGGKAIPTEEDIRISSSFRKLLGEGGIENVSTGIAKIKSNTLSAREKALLGFDSKGETFADDIKATTYLYLKHYMEAKQYADANPDLKLTEEDLRSMAILGHNQGMNKLLSVGANSFRSKEDEVQMLRDLSEKDSRTKDITSTKFKYLEKVGLGALGDKLYDMKYPEGHSTYVGRVKSYGDSLHKYQTGGLYNMDRAKELGYEPDETGHMPSVDDQTGVWLKSKEHPTAWMEYLHATLNQRTAQNETVIVDPEGYFGENQLQYVPRNKYQRGGQYDPTPASSTRVSMPPMLPLGQMVQDNERVRRIEENQRLASQLPNELKYQGPIPDNGKIDYRYTDRRSSNYVGNPDMAFMAPGKTGQMRADAETYHNTIIGEELASLGIGAGISKGVKILKNSYRYNPWAFKPVKSNWYRQVGKSAIDDALKTKLIREAEEEVSLKKFQEFEDQLIRMRGHGMEAALASRRPASPFFNKGELFYPMERKPIINKTTGKLSNNPAGAGSADYLIETNLPNESFQPAYVKGMSLGVPTEVGETAILKPDPNLRNLKNFNLYKRHWLQGYKKIPNYQTGGPVPTKADSLFLLNNNKIIQKLLDSGYQWSDNVPISKPPFDSKKDAIEAVKKIYARDTDKTKGISRKGELKDYISIKGEMVGSSDWRPGGGEDKGVPMQYVHPSIAPQFKGDLISPRDQDPAVFSYGYENLAITPWSMLTPAQKADRRMLYGDAGTPFEKSIISATTSSTPVPVKTSTLNKQTYTGIDPISRYQLPERQIEEVQIPSMPAVTSGNIQETVQGYNTRKGNLRYNRSTREWEQIPYGYMNKGDNRGRIEP